jgi:hypothetical protein
LDWQNACAPSTIPVDFLLKNSVFRNTTKLTIAMPDAKPPDEFFV